MRYSNTWYPSRVVHMQEITANVMEIHILPETGTQPFGVGAHLEVEVFINNLPEIRQYSILGTYVSNAPFKIAVKRVPNSRGGSQYMWGLRVGSTLRISQPKTNFELERNATDYLLIAGGIGITPILGMAQLLSKQPGAKVRLMYLGTSRKEMPFLTELKSWLGDRLYLHFSDTDGLCDPTDLLEGVTRQTQVYLCGPMGLMEAIRSLWERQGYPVSNLRFETFANSGNFAAQKFRVIIPHFHTEIEVQQNETLLQALEKAQIEVLYDCKKGECGLCQVAILEYSGQIDHRDLFFSAAEKAENKKLCACVSRVANGSITIDTGYRR